MQLPLSKPFNAGWTFPFLGRRAIPGLEEVEGCCYRRRLGEGWMSVTLQADALRLEAPAGMADIGPSMAARIRRLFDADADSQAIDAHLAADPGLRPWVCAARGIRVPGVWDGFEGAVKAVLGQQVSLDRSIDLAAKLTAAFGDDGFPSADALADADVAAIGVPGVRGAAVRGLARAVLDQGAEFLHQAPALREVLPSIKGIGPWTTEYVAMRIGRDPDAFPAADWVVRKMLNASAKEALRRAQRWRPWRAYAVMYLWHGSMQTP